MSTQNSDKIDAAINAAGEAAKTMTDQQQADDVDANLQVAEVEDKSPLRKTISSMPTDIDASSWPSLRLRHLRMENFGPHDDVEMEFGPSNLHVLIGPNGTGKTTSLVGVQMLFANFDGVDFRQRYLPGMLRYVRNWMHMTPTEQAAADFSVLGSFEIREKGETNWRSYTMELRRQKEGGFIGRHPGVVRFNLPHFCHFARFDQELEKFQLLRKRWPIFKELFTAVTGYEVETDEPMLDGHEMSQTADRRMQKWHAEWYGGFKVHKPRETISHRQCSAGERKIAKCLSTILNKSAQPAIICIDNVTDHIDLSRHLPVLNAIERCFPNSQVLATCHSAPVQHNISNRDRLIDLRFLHASELVTEQPWRLRLYDEVVDSIDRIRSLQDPQIVAKMIHNAELLKTWLLSKDASPDTLSKYAQKHLQNTLNLFVAEAMSNTPLPRIHNISQLPLG